MFRIILDKIESDFSAAKTHKQFISVSETSTDVQSDFIILMITSLHGGD